VTGSLAASVATALDGDVLVVPGGVHSGDGIELSAKSLTLVGEAGAVIIGTSSSQTLLVQSGARARLMNLQLIGSAAVPDVIVASGPGTELLLEGCTLGPAAGRGLVLLNEARVDVRRSVVRENLVGGAQLESALFVIDSTLFVANGAADSASGALRIVQAATETSVLTRLTVVDNAQPIQCDVPATLLESIVYFNTGGAFRGPCASTSSNVEGSVDLDVDPLFLDRANGDYHLADDSPCIDVVSDGRDGLDLDGEQRPRGEGGDLGADESL
jgi:hypothetical protein